MIQRPRILPTRPNVRAMSLALLTPGLLGLAPIFGKLAIGAGADSFSVAAIRTIIAVALLWTVYGLFFRRYIFIYPAGLLGCAIVGAINGLGSLFFYGGLGTLDASLVQLINGLYVVFAVFLTHLDGERLDRRTLVRVGLAVVGLLCVAGLGSRAIDWLGVGLMVGSAIMFAGTVVLSQYVLYEMPSQTATLYILTTMAIVVVVVWVAVGTPISLSVLEASFWPILLLGITTALSRLTMFASVQAFGSLRTVIVAIAEIAVTLALAYAVLGERLTGAQTVGVLFLLGSVLLVRARDLTPRRINLSTLLVRDVASVQFQRIAFHRAFGRREHDNEFGVMGALTTAELLAIQKMMGVSGSPVDPFPRARNADELVAFLNTTSSISDDASTPSKD